MINVWASQNTVLSLSDERRSDGYDSFSSRDPHGTVEEPSKLSNEPLENS